VCPLVYDVIPLNGVSGIGINETTKINIVIAIAIGNLRNRENALFINLFYFTAKIPIFFCFSGISAE
jgi:hypothetical protein